MSGIIDKMMEKSKKRRNDDDDQDKNLTPKKNKRWTRFSESWIKLDQCKDWF
jgi:hypothetical protein